MLRLIGWLTIKGRMYQPQWMKKQTNKKTAATLNNMPCIHGNSRHYRFPETLHCANM